MTWTLVNHSRKGWIDALRGLAILLVIYGHCAKDLLGFFVFTSPVKMPLFFAITGYLLSIKSSGAFVNQLLRKVIVPWLFLGLLPSFLLIPFKGLGNVLSTFLDMLSGKELWFFPCYIIGFVLHYLIRRLCKTTALISITALACFVVGIVLCDQGILDYAMANRAFTVQPFFLIGYLFKSYERNLVNLRWSWLILLSFLYLGLCGLSMVFFPGQTLDVHLSHYYNIPYCLFLIFLGCFLLFIVGAKSNFYTWAMSFIGQNTLVLYIWHSIAIAVLVKGLFFVGWEMPSNWWTALIKVIWACLLCGVCAVLLNRYLPFAVGKKSQYVNNK